METPELFDFALRARATTLVARRRDGSPTGWPMTVLSPGDGHLYFNTYGSSAKAKMIARDPRVAFLLIGDTRAVEVVADAARIDDAGERLALADRVVRKEGVPDEVVERTRDRLRTGKRILLRMIVRTTRSFDLAPAYRNELRPAAAVRGASDSGRAGKDRASLALDAAEVRDYLSRATSGVAAHITEDGYPAAEPVALELAGERLRVVPPPPDGRRVGIVIDRGRSYDDYIAAIVHGTAAGGTVALDDVVSFEFARAQR